jgi:hypothetical protein
MAISAQKLLPATKSTLIKAPVAKITKENLSLDFSKKVKPIETPTEDTKTSKKFTVIESVIVNIRNLLKKRAENKKDTKFEKSQTEDKEQKLKKEGILEEKKSKPKSDTGGIEAPNLGIFDRIKRIVGLLFFGWLINKFFKYIPQILGIVEKFIQTVEGIRKFLKPITDTIFSGLKFVITEGGKALAKLVGVKLDDKEKNVFVIINELDKKLRFLDFIMGSMILYDIFDVLTDGLDGNKESLQPRSKPKIQNPTAASKNAYDDVIKKTKAGAKTYGKSKLSWKDVQRIYNKKGWDGLTKVGLSTKEKTLVSKIVEKAEEASSLARRSALTYDSRVKARYEQKFGKRAASRRFTPEKVLKKQRAIPKLVRGVKAGLYKAASPGLRKGAFKLFGSGAKSLKMASGFMKKIPFIGSIIGLGVDLALGEPFDRALVGALGAGLGAWIGVPLGSAVFGFLGSIIPGLGTVIGLALGAALGGFIGGWIGDFLAKKLYEIIKPKFTEIFKKAFPDFDLSIMGKEDKGSKSSGGKGGVSDSSPAMSGDTQSKAKMMYDYIRSKGYSDNQAKGLVANIQRESTFRPGISVTDSNGLTSGGLFQFNGTRFNAMVKNVPNWKNNWKGQIDYAMIEDVGPQYKGKQFSNSAAAAWWWVDNWERSGDKSGDQQKHINYLNQYKFGSGGGDDDVKSGMTPMNVIGKGTKNSTMAASLVPGVSSPTSSSLATSSAMKYQPEYYGNKTYLLPINTTVFVPTPSKDSSSSVQVSSSQQSTALNTNSVNHMLLQQ